MKQVDSSEWKEISPHIYVCTVPFFPEEMEVRFSIKFEAWKEDGLGRTFNAIVNIDGMLFWLMAQDSSRPELRKVIFFILGNERWPELAVQKICKALSLSEIDLVDRNPILGPARWVLVRLDDNGNETEMYRFLVKMSAEYVKKSYEEKGHKQSYFLREVA